MKPAPLPFSILPARSTNGIPRGDFILTTYRPRITHCAGFLSEQAAESYLKNLVTGKGVRLRRVRQVTV